MVPEQQIFPDSSMLEKKHDITHKVGYIHNAIFNWMCTVYSEFQLCLLLLLLLFLLTKTKTNWVMYSYDQHGMITRSFMYWSEFDTNNTPLTA